MFGDFFVDVVFLGISFVITPPAVSILPFTTTSSKSKSSVLSPSFVSPDELLLERRQC